MTFVRRRNDDAELARVTHELVGERAEIVVAGHRDLAAQVAQDVVEPLVEIPDARREPVGVQRRAQHVARWRRAAPGATPSTSTIAALFAAISVHCRSTRIAGYGSCAASRRSTASRTGCISGAWKSVA